jgi:hypothetical protein
MVTFLAIQGAIMEPILKVSSQGQTRWVAGEPVQQTAIVARPIDVQSLATQTIAANNDMVTAILRSMTPTIDSEPSRAQPGLSSPAELAARNERFRWVIVAVVLLAAVTAAGIVSVAYLAGHVSGPGALAGWLVLSGVAGYLSVTYVHHREANLSPEALEGERIRSTYDIAVIDAESRSTLAAAYAQAVRDDAAARRASAEAQRQANLQLAAPTRQPMDYTPRQTAQTPAQAAQEASQVYRTETPSPSPVRALESPTAPVAPAVAPDPLLVKVLAELDRLHGDYLATGRTLITERLPWSARGTWPQADKERTRRNLAALNVPPIVAGDGNRAHWCTALPWRIIRQRIIESWR